jgi:imidazolonepropionase-like amidohydrolase
MNRPRVFLTALAITVPGWLVAQEPKPIVLRPARVVDGVADKAHDKWVVVVRGRTIEAAGPASTVLIPKEARVIDLAGMTLLPGLIDAHSHLFLHPYDEASWTDQATKEPFALRVCRATEHARRTLMAGFTTLRDLGTEGAEYGDVGVKQAIEQGIIPGPRLLVVTRAIVATASYGPKGFDPRMRIPQGAEEADGIDDLTRVVRDQIGHGADWVKVYADYPWGPDQQPRPTFSLDELKRIVSIARDAGCPVAAHAMSKEGMVRAALAEVTTIEHGDAGDAQVFELMAARGVALCPTLAASEAMNKYRGWKPGSEPEPAVIKARRAAFKAALAAGIVIVNGSDVGVFAHGEEARELELLVDYGMQPIDAIRSATSAAARVLRLDDRLGIVKAGLLADLIAVDDDPSREISSLRKVRMVMKAGVMYRTPP